MNVETRIKLDKFKPRDYQLPLLDAILNKGYKRVIGIWPRRAGKDICGWNIIIRAALQRIGTYFYVFPTYSSGRKILWDAINIQGMRVLDYLPNELIESKNEQLMRIRLKNGSSIQVIGSDNYDNSIVGTNPVGIVWSEYAIMDPMAYSFARPILAANDGWSVFLSTPRGKNFFWEMLQIAEHSPEWFVHKLTIEDTNHLSPENWEREKREMSEDLLQQEYYCSFSLGVEGSFYAKYIDRIRINGQIGQVPWEPSFRVNSSWDIGVRDSTSIILYQCVGQVIRIVDCYENNKQGLEHYVEWLSSKPYLYGKHFAPFDIKVKEWGSGITRWEKARQLGIEFHIADSFHDGSKKIGLMDGIEAARSIIPKCWIDEVKCDRLIKCLENYRQEYDSKNKVYKSQPLHNEFSHMADAFRYLALSQPKTKDGMSEEDFNKQWMKVVYGDNSSMPAVFRNDLPNY